MRAEALASRPECPEPGRWSAPDEWATETEVSRFVADLVRALKPDFVVETGSYVGYTAEQIGLALRDLGRGRLVSIELVHAKSEQARARTAGLPVTIVTNRAAHVEPDQPIDLLFVDSGFTDRMVEVRHFRQWASPRCVILAHDSAVPTSYPGVPEFFADLEQVVVDGLVHPWLRLPTPRGLALTRYR
ncbi:MAG TPA: class I SAM-dependent methyltransferase [Rhizomicrobium sp.]|jgi:predicted O-methyltransferase YrrM|nr:class I SAM-dependent methyltransferase [Rhizomicrobium sp.]